MISTERLYRTALVCGLVPLGIGCAIFLLWLATRWDWLMFAGLATMWAGIASVLAGGICLALFAVKSAAQVPRPPIGPRVALGLAALVVNLPAAFGIIVVAGHLFFCVELTVVNRGPAIDKLVVAGGCAEADLGRILAGATRVERIQIQCDGVLEFEAARGGQMLSGTIAGYVTPGEHLDAWLTLAPDGTWSVGTAD